MSGATTVSGGGALSLHAPSASQARQPIRHGLTNCSGPEHSAQRSRRASAVKEMSSRGLAMRRRLCRPWRPYWELASRDSLHFDSPTSKRPRGLSKLPYCARRFAGNHKRNPDCGFAKRQFPWALLAPWPVLLAQSQQVSEDRPNRSELDESSGSTSVTSVGFGNCPMKVMLAREHPPSQRLRARIARAMMTRMDRCRHAGYSTLLMMIPCYLIETDSWVYRVHARQADG